jgi:serine/threonine protein kinase
MLSNSGCAQFWLVFSTSGLSVPRDQVVHFDLKPDNLLLDGPLLTYPGYAAPSVKVADFGLSKHKWSNYVSGVRDLRCAPACCPSSWRCCQLVEMRSACSSGAVVCSLSITAVLPASVEMQHVPGFFHDHSAPTA